MSHLALTLYYRTELTMAKPPRPTSSYSLRLTQDLKDLASKAATADGVDLATYIRKALIDRVKADLDRVLEVEEVDAAPQ